MKISKTRLRQIIMEELNEARSRLRPQDPRAWEEEKKIVKGAPYPDEEALELFDKVSRLYTDTGISNRYGRLLPDKGADDVNAFFARRARHLANLEAEHTADLPKIIWSYGGEPNRGQPSLEKLRKDYNASENDYPDPTYYDEEIDTKSGIRYWRRKGEFDASTEIESPFPQHTESDRVHWRESRNKETGKTLEEMLQWLSQWATSLGAHHADTPEDKERLQLVHLTIEEAIAELQKEKA